MATDKLKKCSPSSSAGDTAAKRLGISRTAWLHLAAGDLLKADRCHFPAAEHAERPVRNRAFWCPALRKNTA
jgi:hypothetical protein